VSIDLQSVINNPLICAIEIIPFNGTVSSSTGAAAPGSIAASSSARAQVPPAAFRVSINSGAATTFSDLEGRTWLADVDFIGGQTFNGQNTFANTTADLFPVYNSNRFNQPSYSIPVPAAGQYGVVLHYAEIFWGAPGRRLFSVSLQSDLVIPSLDIFAEAGGIFAALTTSHVVNVTMADLTVSITTVNLVDNALVSGIEVFSLF
jgi:Malectin domain